MSPTLRLILAAALAIATNAAAALQTERLLDDTLQNFTDGDPTTSTLTWDGRVAPPFLREKLHEVPAAVAWDIVNHDGARWVATGHEGKLMRENPVTGELETVREYDESGLYTLLSRNGELLVGATPTGRVYRLSGTDAADDPAPIETGQRAVWAMLDTPEGLLVGTGPEGLLVRVDDTGTTSTLLNYPLVKNVLTLAALPESRDVIAGTQGVGLVLRIAPDGTHRVLLDPQQDEVRRVGVMPDGTILAAVNGNRSPNDRLLAPPPADGNSAPAAARVAGAAAKTEPASFIARIHPNGHADEWWTSPESPIHDMIALEDGRVMVAAGNRGRLFEIQPDGNTNHIGIAEEEYLVRLAPGAAPGEVIVGTGATAALYRIDTTSLGNGEFNSQIFDAKGTASWASARVATENLEPGSILFRWRTGNTAKPGDSWADWSAPVALTAAGEVDMRSPVARFFQYRLEFATEGGNARRAPRVDFVRTFYTLPNRAPRVLEVRVAPPSPRQGGGARPANAVPPPSLTGRMMRPPHSTVAELEVTWRAEDPNGDALIQDLYIRGTDDARWTLVQEDILASPATIPANLFPDGHYRARIVASDRISMPAELALEGDGVSDLFLIDNGQPDIAVLAVDRDGDEEVTVRVEVRDSLSIIASAAWRAGFGDWQHLLPVDGVADSTTEIYTFTITGGDAMPGSFVSVLATDEAGNTSILRVPL